MTDECCHSQDDFCILKTLIMLYSKVEMESGYIYKANGMGFFFPPKKLVLLFLLYLCFITCGYISEFCILPHVFIAPAAEQCPSVKNKGLELELVIDYHDHGPRTQSKLSFTYTQCVCDSPSHRNHRSTVIL